MPDANAQPKEYRVFINTDDIHEAIASAASALYAFAEEALIAHENHESEECDFEDFSRDILGVLMRHADLLSGADSAWEERKDDELQYE